MRFTPICHAKSIYSNLMRGINGGGRRFHFIGDPNVILIRPWSNVQMINLNFNFPVHCWQYIEETRDAIDGASGPNPS